MTNETRSVREDALQVRVSAVHLAELGGVAVREIHYWAQEGLLRRTQNGTRTPFHASDLNKVRLMRYLTREYGMKAVKAAHVADELLEMHIDEPEAYQAALGLLEAFEKGLAHLARILAKMGLTGGLVELGLVDSEGARDPLQRPQGDREEEENA